MKAASLSDTLCCTALYTVHRCFGKTDAFIISLVTMVTKMDVSVKDPRVCLVQACAADCLPITLLFSESRVRKSQPVIGLI